MNDAKISVRQFTILVMMFTIGSSILLVPSALSVHAKQDAWLSAIVGTLAGLLIIALLNAIVRRYPDLTFTECIEKLLGRWIGKCFSLLYVIYAFLLSVVLLRYIGDFITTQMMPETPIESILILFLIVVIIAVNLGIETLARAAELFFPWIILLLVLIIVFVMPQINFKFIQPVLANGIRPIVHGSLPLIGIPFMELVLLLMITPRIKTPDKVGGAFLLGGAIGSAILIAFTLMSILVLGPFLSAMHIYPSFTLTKKINIGDFFQRIEAILAVVWFLTIFFKLTLTYYALAEGLARLLGLSSHRRMLGPLGIICFIYALIIYPNVMYGIKFAGSYWTLFATTYGLLLPLLLLIVSFFRKGRSPRS